MSKAADSQLGHSEVRASARLKAMTRLALLGLVCVFALGLEQRVPAPVYRAVVPKSVAEITRHIVESQGVTDSSRIIVEFVTDERHEQLGEAVVREHERESWLYDLPHAWPLGATRVIAAAPVSWYREVAKEWLRRQNGTHPVISAEVVSRFVASRGPDSVARVNPGRWRLLGLLVVLLAVVVAIGLAALFRRGAPRIGEK